MLNEALNWILTDFYEEFKSRHDKTTLSKEVNMGSGIGWLAIDEKSRLEEFEFTKKIFGDFFEKYVNNISPIVLYLI